MKAEAVPARREPIVSPFDPIALQDLHLEFTGDADWQRWLEADRHAPARREFEASVLRSWQRTGTDLYFLPGLCQVCGHPSSFLLDAMYSPGPRDNGWEPNWRERLECTTCGLNNRRRATIQWLRPLLPHREKPIWIAEHGSPLTSLFAAEGRDVIESEYLGEGYPVGSVSETGIRHEDATATSFEDGSLAAIVCMDVLEHIPRYRDALAEAYRVLEHGGVFAWTAPFDPALAATKILASIKLNGAITHHEPPEYHGDPMNPDVGILCYQRFGWDVLEQCREAGFTDATVTMMWSASTMNIGMMQLFVSCLK